MGEVLKAGMLRELARMTEAAGSVALAVRRRGITTETKEDGTPVTSADRASQVLLEHELGRCFPEIPVIGEEGHSERLQKIAARRYFLVDPLDGTREFIAGRDEFTVNIALIEDGYPTHAAIHAPALGRLVVSSAHDGAYEVSSNGVCHRLQTRRLTSSTIIVLTSRSHGDAATRALLARLPSRKELAMGSSWKFVLVAAGEADLYARLSPTMAWDTAAGQAIIEAAGGAVMVMDGTRLRYDAECLRNPGFIAVGSAALGAALVRDSDADEASRPDMSA